MAKKAEVTIAARMDAGSVAIDVHNATKEAVTIVTHPRYLIVELLDGRGQFIRGQNPGASMPTKKDFVDVPIGGTVSAFSLPAARDGETVTIGSDTFKQIPDKTEIRVTYKPDALVPNLPSSQRRSFFRGPIQSERVALLD